MKRKRYEAGGDVEDYEKTAADYDDERPSGSFQSRSAIPVKTVSRAASRRAPKPAPKAAEEAPKPAAKAADEAPKAAPTRSRDFIDRLPASSGLRQLRARGMGETLPSGPSAEDVEAARSRIVERERAMRDRPTGLGRMFSAIRARGSQGTQSYAKGGAVSASRRADGIAVKGKTKGRMI